jgi:hypothetical protein
MISLSFFAPLGDLKMVGETRDWRLLSPGHRRTCGARCLTCFGYFKFRASAFVMAP